MGGADSKALQTGSRPNANPCPNESATVFQMRACGISLVVIGAAAGMDPYLSALWQTDGIPGDANKNSAQQSN